MENSIQIYLDHAATTPMRKEVIDEMYPYFLKDFGNPSSLHSAGQIARDAVENSREMVARCLNVKREEIIFTGGGTESDNLAILGTARTLKPKGNHIITSNIEHPAVKNTMQKLEEEGFEITKIPVNSDGVISVEKFEELLQENTILVSIMHVNNEIGTIQPIESISEITSKKNIIFHTDAVQSYGKIPIDLKKIKVDLLSASSHKIYGPKGVGLLYVRNEGKHEILGKFIKPIIFGGGHESGFRPSTENVPGIVGFAKASELAFNDIESEMNRLVELRNDFINWALKELPDCFLNGSLKDRIPHNINLGFKYIEGEALILLLNTQGVQASTGSACSTNSLEPSHVLKALGTELKNIHGSLRLTMGRDTTQEQLSYVKEKLALTVKKLRELSPLVD